MTNDNLPPVIGLVGGVGSGKSTAAAEFAALGCAVVDADKIGHELLGDDEVRSLIAERWGGCVIRDDGSVDRAALGEIVFGDADEREHLNAIMWPRMDAIIADRLAALRRRPGVPAVVLDAAVMFEAGWDRFCTHIIFIEASPEVRAARAAGRGLSGRQWQVRENSQISLDSKRGRCYRVIDNSFSVSHLREQVRHVFRRIAHAAE